jgi:hypothetical protein
MYNLGAINAELAIQSRINPADAASQSAFRDFAVNVQKFRVYFAMLGGQPYVSMIHTPGVYYSIDVLTSAYQGKVLAFMGDRRATKEPTPVWLPSTKAWGWHTGDANTDFAKLEEYYTTDGNKDSLWRPGANDGAVATVKVPNLLAILNALVDLLQAQGAAITPHNVLAMVDDFLQSSHHPPGNQWDCVCKWCLVACQAGTNGKSEVFLETTPVTIDDADFDRWVGNRLDVLLGPRPSMSTAPAAGAGATGNQQAMDYLALSKMLATSIGSNMLQFSQAVAPQAGVAAATGGDTALAMGKGFNQDQIAKLKDACGVRNAQQILALWSPVIQATKGKSIDTYWAHIAKAIKSWCCAHHIDRDKTKLPRSQVFRRPYCPTF